MFPLFRSVSLLLAFFCLAVPGWALTQVNVGEDQANQGMYNGGWNDGTGGDNGFFVWKMVTKSDGEGSFAGHYLGKLGEKPEVAPITTDRVFRSSPMARATRSRSPSAASRCRWRPEIIFPSRSCTGLSSRRASRMMSRPARWE